MRILITGSSGFLGKHVVAQLADQHELFTPSHDELNILHPTVAAIHTADKDYYFTAGRALTMYMHANKIEAIIHLAATCGGIGINKENPGKFIYENLQMGVHILEAARLSNIKKVVLLGTVCMYPKHTPVPFKEEDIYNGYPEETNAPYGIAKRTIMEMGDAYHRQYGLNVTNLIPVNMAGEGDNFDESSSHVIPALIKKFESPRHRHPEPYVELWGTGSASREFLYAGDCARAIALSLETDTGPAPINLGTGKEITIKELAELVKQVGQYDAEIHWDSTKPDGQPRRSLDITRAKETLGWEPSVELEETIRRTITWYRTQKTNA
jgi:nucleoside-diphosphate-sugar epimerase